MRWFVGLAVLSATVMGLSLPVQAQSVEVVPGFAVPEAEAPAVAVYFRSLALASGDYLEIEGELVERTLDLDTWLRLADCEWRGASWHARTTGNSFYGRFQWALSTWRSLDATVGYDYPDEAPISVQLAAARENLTRSGWGQWPGCARHLGYWRGKR